MTRPLAALLAVAFAVGCEPEPTAQNAAPPDTTAQDTAGSVSTTTPRVVSASDSLFFVFEDILHNQADPVVAAVEFDAFAARFNAQPWHQAVVDTLDFDGDGVADRLLATPERVGLIAALYLARGDSLVRAQHAYDLHLGQSYAVCHEPGRRARIYTFRIFGTQFDVRASELRLADGRIWTVADESFPIWPDGSPETYAAHARLQRRAEQLEARTEGPPPGCAFRCSSFDCCAAGQCRDDGRAPWHAGSPAGGA